MHILELFLDWEHSYKSVVMIFSLSELFTNQVFFCQNWSGYVCKVHVVGVPDLRVRYILCNVDIGLGVNQKEGLRKKH